MKKLINEPVQAEREGLEGLALAHRDLLQVRYDPTFVMRSDAPVKGKVAMLSGGGAGHEPLHSGYVGRGMLDAACPGRIFTSPTPDQALAAAEAVHGGAGVLFVVKNYSGDVMNFELAVEMAHAQGIRARNVVVDDDVAVADSLYTQGRRGVGTTVLLEKICGAAAEKGYDLERLAALARRVVQGGRSLGIALTPCTVPAHGRPTFTLEDDEIEFGVGIHGEPGRERLPRQPADVLVERMTRAILDDGPYARSAREWDPDGGTWQEVEALSPPFAPGDRVLAFVNSLGGTPLSELHLVYRKMAEVCASQGVEIVRSLVGPYITSLEMQGCSITLLRVDDELIELWDAPVHTPSLRWGC